AAVRASRRGRNERLGVVLRPRRRRVMTRIGAARIAVTLALVTAGLVCQIAPADAVAHRAGSRAVRPAIAAGNSHSCVLLSNGWVKCWGNDSNGQLGNGTV